VVRNDKLGDLMLAWPALAMLRQGLPDCGIDVLANAYTEDMARLCPSINEVILDPGPAATRNAGPTLMNTIRSRRYDAAIVLYATTRIARVLWQARIPCRVAPATKVAQLFSNRRLRQRRSRSEKPEYAYNEDLAAYYLRSLGIEPTPAKAPLLRFDEADVAALDQSFRGEHGIAPGVPLVFLHPGSGGSARNLSAAQYAALARGLRSPGGHHLVISAGPGEEAHARSVASGLGNHPHTVYISSGGLQRFALHLACGALFVGGSTGPLHIAGALDLPTAAFYPRRRSATSLRWQTMNRPEHRLAFCPPPDADEEDMSRVDIDTAAGEISARFLA
jgi:ADP-heptose:LPS heptosyltransferase